MLLLVAACGQTQVPTTSPALDTAGKQFSPPPANLAAIYFNTPTSAGPIIRVAVGVNTMVQVAPQTWMRLERQPGWHELRCISPGSVSATTITLAPGDLCFVDVEQPPGQATCTIRETAPELGRRAVLQGNRVMPL
ncbi:MAG: hypothetical protein EXR12_11915 [Rhodospirillaceae bacterium]|nr:hypothetical protein [Rhodospirillaceae bacterium]